MESKLMTDTKVECYVHLVLTEDEARALEAICGYGPDKFVEWFYRNHGKHYLKPHEKGIITKLKNKINGKEGNTKG